MVPLTAESVVNSYSSSTISIRMNDLRTMVAGSVPEVLMVTVCPVEQVKEDAFWSPSEKSTSKTGEAVSGDAEFHILVEKTGPLNG